MHPMRSSFTVPLLLGLALSAAAAPPAPAKRVLPFIDDDYAKALSEARAQHKPLFIEAWAPW